MLNSQMQFIRILQDECLTNKGRYRIVTSIYDLTYRSEIFLDGLLVDALEEECYYLAYDAKKEEFFKNKYIAAHQVIKKRYCKVKKESETRVKKVGFKLNIPEWDYAKLSKIVLGLFFSFLLIFFIKNSQEEVPKESPLLAKKHIPIPTKAQDENTPKVPKSPEVEEHITHKNTQRKPTKLNKPEKIKALFVWSPTENFVIKKGHYFPLSFTNNSDEVVDIELTGRTLQQSSYEEIIQFKDSDIYAKVKMGETKVFQIYIEPTYYEQFDKGKYAGTLSFTLSHKQEQKTVTKQFSFEVD